jgi:uncharacterized protein (UPF0147 family)
MNARKDPERSVAISLDGVTVTNSAVAVGQHARAENAVTAAAEEGTLAAVRAQLADLLTRLDEIAEDPSGPDVGEARAQAVQLDAELARAEPKAELVTARLTMLSALLAGVAAVGEQVSRLVSGIHAIFS